MKILRVIPSINPVGGGPMEGARRIDARLTRLGHTIEVVCLDKPGEDFASSYPVQVHALGPAYLGYGYSPRLLPWLRANHQRFDAVIVNGLWQYHGLAAWQALAGKETPYFVFTHGMLDPWFKAQYPIKHIKKSLYWPWGDYRLLRDAKAVLFTSEDERLLARKSFKLYRANEKVTSYGTNSPPVDTDGKLAASFLASRPELKGKRILLFLSRIHEKKGCDLLIQAFARISSREHNLQLVIAGPDQTGWATRLKAMAVSLGIADRITWPGMLQGDEKWGAFYAAEAFCLPSHQENFGIVVAEALGCGKPVLISNKVNIWREIKADGAGIVYDDNTQGTTQGLLLWLDLPQSEKIAMQAAARHCFVTRFGIDRAADSLIRILQG